MSSRRRKIFFYYPIKIIITQLFKKQGNYPIDQNFICSSGFLVPGKSRCDNKQCQMVSRKMCFCFTSAYPEKDVYLFHISLPGGL